VYATAWHNGGPPREPAGYGLKFVDRDRDVAFDREWTEIVLECEGADAVTLPLSSPAIGSWLIEAEVAPWVRGSPPGVVVTAIEGNRFSARILKRKTLGS
jgi:hypothetical protein